MLKRWLIKYKNYGVGIAWLVLFVLLYGINRWNQTNDIGLLKYFNGLASVDCNWQDQVFMAHSPFKPERKAHDQIVIVGIDDESTEVFGRFPWSRDVMASGIDLICEGNPAAIGVDVLFTEYTDLESGADEMLAESVKAAGNVVIAAEGNALVAKEGKFYAQEINLPYPELKEAATIAHINTIPEKNVVRQTINYLETDEGTLPSFAIALYEQYIKALGLSNENILAFTENQESNGLTYFDYPCKQSDFKYYSFINLFEEDFDFSVFKDAIVLVGPFSIGMMDQYLTPLSQTNFTYGVTIWATILEDMMSGGRSIKTMWQFDLIAIMILGIAITLIVHKVSLLKGGITVGISGISYILLAQWAYSKGIRLSIAYPIVLMILIDLSYLVVKYLKEYKERKHITGVFGKYVAPQVVKKVIEEGEDALQLGGSRRFVTLLFVDIRGFTPMSEKATPEQVVEILNEYLTLCATSIVNNEGTLDKFIGDATMAIYNAPIQIENHALSAVKTALAMKQGSLALEKKLEERFGRSVKFGIGINTGYAVIGNIGCQFRMDYTAIGDTVNTAARLESNAKPGQILISESTYELVKDDVEVTPLGAIKVKGKETLINIYQVERLKEGV